MRLFSVLLFAAAAFAQDGWMDLLPDAKLTGWVRVNVPPTKPLGEKQQWHVDAASKTLICDGDGGHEMLRLDKEFADFIFHVEWKFTPIDTPNPKYNSGVYVRNDADGNIWHQAQAGGDNGGYLFGGTMVNGQKGRINFSKDVKDNRIKPAGQWNVYEIRCEGKKVTLSTNGAVTCTWDQCEVPKGYLALEAEGYRIEFKNIKVKVLK